MKKRREVVALFSAEEVAQMTDNRIITKCGSFELVWVS